MKTCERAVSSTLLSHAPKRWLKVVGWTVMIISASAAGYATTYNVGPGQPYTTLGAVPWYGLAAGDVVNINSNGGCYAEKFLISTQGASWSNPITVQGITNAQGKKPCITGLNAIQSGTSKDRWSGAANAQYSESLYVVGISLQSGLNYGPAYVVLNNLEVTGAAQGASYTADDGSTQTYGDGVAAVRIVNGDHIRIENCYIHGISGNGVFGKPNNSFPGTMADIQLSYNQIAANGVSGNYLYHNSYLEANQTTYIGNLFEPLVTGGPGAHLKDRSAGTIVAYNRFHGSAARYVDLVEPQDGWPDFGSAPYYGSDFVYGNIFEAWSTDPNFDQVGTMIHYGGDQGDTQYYRNRTLSFYDNTLVVTANQSTTYKMGIFEPDLSTANVDLSNNILLFTPQTAGSSTPELDIAANNDGSPVGNFFFLKNWISPGWNICFNGGSCLGGSVSGTSNVISSANNSPGFANLGGENYALASGSPAIGVASTLPSLITSNPQNGNYTPTLQYIPDLQTTTRTSLKDLGAFATTSGSCTYAISPGSLSIGSGSGTSYLTLTAGSGCAWTATTTQPWISVSPSSGSGNATITVTAQSNSSTASRTANVAVQSDQIQVTQAGETACSYQTSPGDVSLSSGSTSSNLSVKTGTSCTWSASSSQSWLSLGERSGTGSGTLKITAQANTSLQARSATVTVQSQAVTVTQSAGAAGQLHVDASVSADQGFESSTLKSPVFSTSAGNELILAFISTDYLSGTNTTVTGVSSPGNTWQLVKRSNGQSGDSEIWRTFAASPLGNVTVTATLSQAVDASMTIMSFSGVNTSGSYGSGAIGATASGGSGSGAPSASLVTTQNNSWVVGVGNDYSQSLSRTPGSNQTVVHQYFPPVGDTYWVQMQTSTTTTAGTRVYISDSWPTADQYNLAICEILP